MQKILKITLWMGFVIALVYFFQDIILYYMRSPCDRLVDVRSKSLEGRIEFLRVKGEVFIGKKDLEVITDVSKNMTAYLKNCCVALREKNIGSQEFLECSNQSTLVLTKHERQLDNLRQLIGEAEEAKMKKQHEKLLTRRKEIEGIVIKIQQLYTNDKDNINTINFVKVTSSRANIRTAPTTTTNNIIVQVSNGQHLDLIGENEKWYKIRLGNGREGWIHHSVAEKHETRDSESSIKVKELLGTIENQREEIDRQKTIVNNKESEIKKIKLKLESNKESSTNDKYQTIIQNQKLQISEKNNEIQLQKKQIIRLKSELKRYKSYANNTVTPTRQSTSSSTGCVLTIRNRLVSLMSDPDSHSLQLIRLQPGRYSPLDHIVKDEGFLGKEGWFQIQAAGRTGWIANNTWTIETKTRGCP